MVELVVGMLISLVLAGMILIFEFILIVGRLLIYCLAKFIK